MEPSSDSPFATFEGPGPLVPGKLLERPLALVAMRAGLRLAVHRLADFGRVGRMGDPPLFAQDPDPVDFLLIGHVVDDAVDIGGLVLQHREAHALGDHLGDLDHLVGHLAEEFLVQKPGNPAREQQHRRRQRDSQVKHDLKLQGARLELHGDRRVPFGAGKGRNFQIRQTAVKPAGGGLRAQKPQKIS